MKIRLIEPEPPGMHVWAKVLLPRLGLPIIAATLKEHGHDVLVYNPTMAPIDWDDVNTSDLVGLSSTTSTATTAYEFAEQLRAKGIPVVIGGSHVTFMADEALEHVDYVARGEGGEQLMLELIDALGGGRELDTIAGLSFKRDGLAVHNPPREALADLDELPFPDLRLLVGSDKLTTMPIMTSWGCPFDCTFCSVTAMFGKKYRFRSAESVIAELKDKRPQRIFFYDDNMAANRKRLKRLLQMMIDEDLVIPWSAQVRTDVVRDTELLDLMRRSGCNLVYLGLESVNQETLDRFEKSQTVADIEKAIKVLHDYGIKSHGMFVLGADDDDVQTVRDTVAFAIRNKIDTVMLNILTPLPGTLAVPGVRRRGPHLRQALGALRRAPRRLRAGAHDALRAADRSAPRLHALLLAAHLAGLHLHAAVHQAAALPLVGHGDHPQLAARTSATRRSSRRSSRCGRVRRRAAPCARGHATIDPRGRAGERCAARRTARRRLIEGGSGGGRHAPAAG